MIEKPLDYDYTQNPFRAQRYRGKAVQRLVPEEPVHCPQCGRKLTIVGKSSSLSFRYDCTGCGYCGPVLSREELYRVI